MKKLFSILLVAGTLAACNSDSNTTEETTPTAPVTPGIDNVNGNVPDTGETIRLNNPMPTDSSTGTTDTTGQR